MDDHRLDALARRLASRRVAFRLAVGGALGAGFARFGSEASGADRVVTAEGRRRCPSRRRCGRRCCGGKQSCLDGSCRTPCAGSACGPFPAGCPLLPADNIWNARVDALPLDPKSGAYVRSIGVDAHAHPDFGSGEWEGGPIGIPFIVVSETQERVPITFYYEGESDPGPYPIPPTAPIEGGVRSDGDRHVLVVDADNCVLYEVFDAHPRREGGWRAGSGAVFDLRSNALRTKDRTSADAAGLPILPGLIRFEEVDAGAISHALRFTAPRTRKDYVWPGRHQAGESDDPDLPPLGQRFRLKDIDVSGYSPANRVILTALKTYGMFLADNGSAWYLSGVPDERWDNDELRQLKDLKGSDFEAVDCTSLMADPDSGQVRSA